MSALLHISRCVTEGSSVKLLFCRPFLSATQFISLFLPKKNSGTIVIQNPLWNQLKYFVQADKQVTADFLLLFISFVLFCFVHHAVFELYARLCRLRLSAKLLSNFQCIMYGELCHKKGRKALYQVALCYPRAFYQQTKQTGFGNEVAFLQN